MFERLLFMTCAAYLVAAFPVCAQNSANYHDSCGGDSCASNAYDLGYRDGLEGRSYTADPQLQNNPQYDAGFSEGEMDAMAETDPLAPPDTRLSNAVNQADALTSSAVAAQEKTKATQYLPPLDETGRALSPQQALVQSEAQRQANDPRQGPDPAKTVLLDCQTSSLDCLGTSLNRQTDVLNLQVDLPPGRILSIETNGFDQIRGP